MNDLHLPRASDKVSGPKEQHTATPWHVSGNAIYATISPLHPKAEKSGIKLAEMSDRGTLMAESQKNNAAFIVRACNSHYDLLAALERSHGALQSMWQILHAHGIAGNFQKSLDKLMEENIAAIAKAEGGTT